MGSLREQREKKILCFRLCYNVPHTNGFGLHRFCLLRHTHTEEIGLEEMSRQILDRK